MTAVCLETALDISNCGDSNANLHWGSLSYGELRPGYAGMRWDALGCAEFAEFAEVRLGTPGYAGVRQVGTT